jgi:hypothetical protein
MFQENKKTRDVNHSIKNYPVQKLRLRGKFSAKKRKDIDTEKDI